MGKGAGRWVSPTGDALGTLKASLSPVEHGTTWPGSVPCPVHPESLAVPVSSVSVPTGPFQGAPMGMLSC